MLKEIRLKNFKCFKNTVTSAVMKYFFYTVSVIVKCKNEPTLIGFKYLDYSADSINIIERWFNIKN